MKRRLAIIALSVVAALSIPATAQASGPSYRCTRGPYVISTNNFSTYAWAVSQGYSCYRVGQTYG